MSMAFFNPFFSCFFFLFRHHLLQQQYSTQRSKRHAPIAIIIQAHGGTEKVKLLAEKRKAVAHLEIA